MSTLDELYNRYEILSNTTAEVEEVNHIHTFLILADK